MPQKQYLTPELVQWIIEQAKDPIWQMGVLASIKKHWFGILSISNGGLIHIHGNQDTGWAHIMSRHGYYSNDLYFGDGALGDPSRFQSSGIPIFDWRQIADDVYAQSIIDTKEHPDAALFIKYTGKSERFTRSGNEPKDFVLILYRDSKIVHSIFPKKSLQADTPKSKLRDFKRALDHVTGEKPLNGEFLTIRIPYVNKEIIKRYVIVVQIELNTMHALAHLQVNWPNGQPRYSIHTLLGFDVDLQKSDVDANDIKLTRFINSFTKYCDFGHMEEVMARTEKHLFADA
ncbi:hypothetical protein SAMN05216464_10888 [Mucilaginibacter pineti]|uniref:Uncharacterized protein n=1 Tax=Mucilaginibacter pineti TaxID=1391627 RepID=A0A1G7EMI2_9SPHI|nr:hypothetical protein [Mucilaginibacter pineti]SDE64812.1 hypothetical protein SAMN05216464_10888 [Mucilaginibacter pineti]